MRCSEHLCQPRRHPGRMALVAVAMLLSLAVRAHDLGVIGPVYPIAEPSLLEVILARLRDAEASGVLARLQRDAQARAKNQIEQPAAIVKLTKTTKARSFSTTRASSSPTPFSMPTASCWSRPARR
jgi:conjugal transfer pilus assembly protein TraW